jgi:hypothetical protein
VTKTETAFAGESLVLFSDFRALFAPEEKTGSADRK